MVRRSSLGALTFLLTLGAVGCSPAGMAVKIGMQVVGKVVADQETSRLAEQLVGQPASAADEVLGPPRDVWRQVNGPAEWRAYPVALDPLDQKRTVVGVLRNRIRDVQLLQRYSSEADIALTLVYFAKVSGKSPAECEEVLGFGRPLLVARSTSTNQLLQVYDARLIKELQSPHNAVLRFDPQNRCVKLDLYETQAESSGG